MEEERDLVVLSDDEGNEFEYEIVDYFEYEGEDYAVLVDAEGGCDCGCDCGCECGDEDEVDTYIMKIVEDGEYEKFVPADDDKLDALFAYAQERLDAFLSEEEDEELGDEEDAEDED